MVLKLLVCALALATSSACAERVGGQPAPARIDLSVLDVGNYPTTPDRYGVAANDRERHALESRRLAEYVLAPREVDPTLEYDSWPWQHVIVDETTLGHVLINDTFLDVAADLTAGFVAGGATIGADPGEGVVNAVMLFPDADTAARVARELEHDDFTYNRTNEPVPIGKYPAAHAHWRPGTPSVGSWLASGRFVLFTRVTAEDLAAGPAEIVPAIERVLDAQIARLAEFTPTPAAELETLPVDPDGLFGRLLPADFQAVGAPAEDELGVYTPRAALHFMPDPVEYEVIYADTGVDAVALYGDALVRTRDAEAAALYVDRASKLIIGAYPVDAPTELTDSVQCFGTQYSGGTELIQCFVTVDRSVARVTGLQVQDVRQKASAQYARMATP